LHFTGKQILALLHIDTCPVAPVVLACNWDYQWLVFIIDRLSVNGNRATGMRVEAGDFFVNRGGFFFVGVIAVR
jgi:hypothetical protein